jgi:hypothetical protein
MSPSRRARAKGRSESGSFLALPHQVLNSPNYLALSAHGCKLLVDVAAQYKGNNNGDLCAAWTLMQKRGWKSRDTLHKASDEIRYYGLLELTRQGGLNSPNLYALTWQPIDACNGKLDVPSTRVASGLWKKPKPPRPKPLKKRSKSEGQHAERVDRHGGRASEQQTE